jgi:hypothetical protein
VTRTRRRGKNMRKYTDRNPSSFRRLRPHPSGF